MKERSWKKCRNRLLSFLLVLAMTVTMVSIPAVAKENDKSDVSPDYRIIHLDCGRKYFSVDNIKSIIDTASSAGFNYLELAVGNDGLRFLLDDMSVTAGDKTYDSTKVTQAIQTANQAYNDDGGSGELTESQMNEIITYAAAKEMEIIPLLNSPGHMNAILSAMTALGIDGDYAGSKNTIDVTNADAVAFTKALLQKYVTYFADQGCSVFNIGADEYANDVYSTGGMGFAQLESAGQYDEFVTYVNELAAMVEQAGMIPMAFNDGIYYDYDATTPIDKNIMIAYWSNGWSGYNVASASYLAEQGFQMINTNGDYYWVLGKPNAQCSAEKAAGFDVETFVGNTTINEPAGAMFCIWSDVPKANTSDSVVADTKDTIISFGNAITGNMESGEEDPDKVVTVTHETTGISVSAIGLNSVNAAKTQANVTIDDAKDIVAYDITPSTSDGNYTGDATVTIPVPSTWTNVRGGVLASASGEQVTGIEGTLSDGKFTFEVPHFSTVIAYELGQNNLEERSVTITAGGTSTDTIKGVNLAGSYNTENPSVATVTVTGSDEIPESYYYSEAKNVTCNDLISYDSGDSWLKTDYYYKADDGNYYPLYAKRSTNYRWEIFPTGYTYTWGYLDTNSNEVSGFRTQEVGLLETGSEPAIAVYSQSHSDGVPASTTVTFTAAPNAANQTTYVTIGNIRYTITVADVDLSQVQPLTIEYWITNANVTADGATSMNIIANDAYSEKGVEISKLVPSSGSHGSNTVVYWKARRLPYNDKQTNESGVDKTVTTTGTDITYIRYWNNSWQYSADGKQWTSKQNGDQFVAYYLQKTDVTDEINTQVVDYGSVKNEWNALNYLASNYVLLDYSVKYESGEEVPSAFPTEKSLGYHCVGSDGSGIQYRTLGMIRAEETAEYEVYLITLTPTADAEGSRLSGSTASANRNYSYNGTEVVAWAASQKDLDASGLETYHSISGKFQYSVGGDPIISGLEIYRQHGMKVTYYVRAKVTEDSLSVHYVDQAAGNEFYNYNIAVASGTVFNEDIKLNDSNWKGNLDNGTVTNINNKSQTVSADLSTLPQISLAYAGRNYTCVQVTRSENGKDVYLYYTFNDTHPVVYDYGLPIKVKASDLGMTNVRSISIENAGRLTSGEATVENDTITYTPNTMSPNIEQIQLEVTYNDGNTSLAYLNMIPATTVYYEDDCGLIEYSYGWKSEGTSGNAAQDYDTTPYGNDSAYNDYTAFSNSSYHVTTVNQGQANQTASFTFTGTGFDIYSQTGKENGLMTIRIANESGETIKTVSVQNTGKDTLYQIPVYSIKDLEHGTYTVTVTAMGAYTNNTFPSLNRGGYHVIDAVQIYNPLTAEGTQYLTDNEANAVRLQVRSALVGAQDYGANGTGNGVLYMNADMTDGGSVVDYTLVGPNNEAYFQDTHSLIGFVLETSAPVDTLQIGAKSADGKSVTLKAVVNGQETAVNISTNTAMNYLLKAGTPTESDGKYQYTVYVSKSAGEGILSITDVKATFETQATAEFKYNEEVVNGASVSAPDSEDAVIKDNGVSITTGRVRYGREMTMKVTTSGTLQNDQMFTVTAGNKTYTVDATSNLYRLTVEDPVNNGDGTYTYTLKFKPYTYNLLLRQTTFTVTLGDDSGAGSSGAANARIYLF